MMRSDSRRGGVLVYVLLVLPIMAAFTSLAVDWGRVQVVKMQLRIAADAAARYGAYGLSYDYTTARSYTTAAAANNSADGSTVVVDSTNDVDLGTWDSTNQTFTQLFGTNQQYANAVRVRTSRTVAGGNPVSLLFAQVIGQNTCDVNASSIATYTPGGYSIVGLNSVSMSGNSSDSYWSTSTTSPGSFSNMGAVATNGNITLSGGARINGNAYVGAGKTVSNPSQVTGTIKQLSTPLSYSTPGGNYATVNDNALLGSRLTGPGDLNLGNNQVVMLTGGTYYIHNLTIGSGTILYFTSATSLYVWGSINLSGSATGGGNLAPGQLKIYSVPSTSGTSPGSVAVTISGGSMMFADLYAPQSAFTLSGSGSLYGSIIALTVSMSGGSSIHYDMASNGFGKVTLVQ